MGRNVTESYLTFSEYDGRCGVWRYEEITKESWEERRVRDCDMDLGGDGDGG